MNNAELITELKYCANIEKRKLLSDAADAIEAAEKRIAVLEAQMPKLPDRQEFLAKGSFIEEPLSRPKEGKWEQHIFDGIMGKRPTAWVCTMCNCLSVYKTDYCPNCGARMRGEHE